MRKLLLPLWRMWSDVVNWQTVRNLGQLRILRVLTRASYVMLVLVPVMAGLWPGVRATLNRYNRSVRDSRLALEAASTRLEDLAARAEDLADTSQALPPTRNLADRGARILRDLDVRLDEIVADYSMKSIRNTALPSVWVRGFLASLLVLVAYLVYELRAPEIVRKYSLKDFARERRDQFAANPSEHMLEQSSAFLRRKFGNARDVPAVSVVSVNRRPQQLDLIAEGAEVEYEFAAREHSASAALSACLYTIAIGIVLYIAYEQTLSVLHAAEWLPAVGQYGFFGPPT